MSMRVFLASPIFFKSIAADGVWNPGVALPGIAAEIDAVGSEGTFEVKILSGTGVYLWGVVL